MHQQIDEADERPEGNIAHAPVLTIRRATGQTLGVVLVLHGGRAQGYQRVRARHFSPSRMIPFARLIHRWGADSGVAVWSLRNRVRGWNGAERTPMHDARWALKKIKAVHPGLPIYLVGHSMGGSVALSVADDPRVDAVVSLAPWVDDNFPTSVVAGRRVLIMHGERDGWTSAANSLHYARRALGTAREIHYVGIQGVGHFMFARLGIWHGLTASFILRAFAERTGASLPPDVTAMSDQLYSGNHKLPLVM